MIIPYIANNFQYPPYHQTTHNRKVSSFLSDLMSSLPHCDESLFCSFKTTNKILLQFHNYVYRIKWNIRRKLRLNALGVLTQWNINEKVCANIRVHVYTYCVESQCEDHFELSPKCVKYDMKNGKVMKVMLRKIRLS